MGVEISLPDYFRPSSMYQFISHIGHGKSNLQKDEIILNFETLRFIEASGTTILHNIMQWLKSDGIDVSIKLPNLPNFTDNNNPIKYLDDTGFFEYYLGRKIFGNSRLRATTIPIKNICIEEYYEWLENVLFAWLKGLLNVEESLGFSGLQTCIAEIFNNIKDHSGKKIGCAFAQHYPVDHRIEIAISDFGVGIPFNVRTKIECEDDASALKLAVQEGFTTKSVPTNRGAGLDHLVGFITGNGGSVDIYSCKGQLKFYFIDKKIKLDSHVSKEDFPGTLFVIKLPTNAIYQEPVEEDFSW